MHEPSRPSVCMHAASFGSLSTTSRKFSRRLTTRDPPASKRRTASLRDVRVTLLAPLSVENGVVALPEASSTLSLIHTSNTPAATWGLRMRTLSDPSLASTSATHTARPCWQAMNDAWMVATCACAALATPRSLLSTTSPTAG